MANNRPAADLNNADTKKDTRPPTGRLVSFFILVIFLFWYFFLFFFTPCFSLVKTSVDWLRINNYYNITTDYLLKDEIETIDGADNYSSKNVDMQMLNKELSENDFQNIRYEAEKKKHTSYWLLIIAPFIMILIIFIFYYGFYR